MSGNRVKPDLTLVTMIHQSLRADAARLGVAIKALDPATGRPGCRPHDRPGYPNDPARTAGRRGRTAAVSNEQQVMQDRARAMIGDRLRGDSDEQEVQWPPDAHATRGNPVCP
jgi:hypothetical protein